MCIRDSLGTVPICEYGTPSTNEIPDSLMPYIQTNDSFLLKNHGALTIGNTLEKAYFLMESTESVSYTHLSIHNQDKFSDFTEVDPNTFYRYLIFECQEQKISFLQSLSVEQQKYPVSYTHLACHNAMDSPAVNPSTLNRVNGVI